MCALCETISFLVNVKKIIFAEGFKEAAEKFQDECGLPTEVDLKTMDNRIRIRDSIQSNILQ